MKIGIFGGSFDPVHVDHVNICEKFSENFGLDKTLLFPAGISPFKNGCAVSGEQRAEMLGLAFENFPHGKAEIRLDELARAGKSYTCDTVTQTAAEYEKKAEEAGENLTVYLLIGEDSARTFHLWKNPQIILQKCEIVIAGRGSGTLEETALLFEKNNGKKPFLINTNGRISSTLAREAIKLDADLSGILPEKVAEYVAKNRLYALEKNDKNYKYYSFVTANCQKKRLKHTAGVICQASEYAKKLNQSVEKASLAALLHDCAKYLNPEDYKIEGFNCDGVPQPVIHQFLGAFVAEKILGVTDGDVISAIKWHTTGKPGMNELEKIIWTADLLEPSRDFNGVEELRVAVDRDFESGFRLCVSELYKFLKKDGAPLYMTDEVYSYYCGQAGAEGKPL